MKPLVLSLGLLGIGGFSWAGWSFLHDEIAQSLASQAQQVLDEQGMQATVTFDHLDGLVRGLSTEAQRIEVQESIKAAIPAARISFVDEIPQSTVAQTSPSAPAPLSVAVSPATAPTTQHETSSLATEASQPSDIASNEKDSPNVPEVSRMDVQRVSALDETDSGIANSSPVSGESPQQLVYEPTPSAIESSESHSTGMQSDDSASPQISRVTQRSEERVPPRLGVYMSVRLRNSEVRRIEEGSAAAEAGIRVGDRVTALGGVQVWEYSDVTHVVKKYAAGDEVEIVIDRNGERLVRHVTLKAAAAPPESIVVPRR